MNADNLPKAVTLVQKVDPVLNSAIIVISEFAAGTEYAEVPEMKEAVSKLVDLEDVERLQFHVMATINAIQVKRPEFSVTAKLALHYPKITIAFNDRYQNSITLQANNLYRSEFALQTWLKRLVTISSDGWLETVDDCLERFYAGNELGSVNHSALKPITAAVHAVV